MLSFGEEAFELLLGGVRVGCSRGVGVGDGTGDWVSLFGYATLSRSIDTVSGDPLMSRVKNLSAVLRILKGPL